MIHPDRGPLAVPPRRAAARAGSPAPSPCAVAGEQALQPHQVGRPAGPGGLPSGLGLQQQAQVVDLHDLVRVDRPHLHAADALAEQPIRLQPAQRLTHRGAGDPELPGERDPSQRGARRQLAGEDLGTQLRIYRLGVGTGVRASRGHGRSPRGSGERGGGADEAEQHPDRHSADD
jgi:hypothetical protein